MGTIDRSKVVDELAAAEIRVPAWRKLQANSAAFLLPENPHDGSFGLTLSGGGFRATLFHLGVVKALHDTDRLKDVRVISAVSGGSILAAYLGLHWEQFTSSHSDFAEAAKPLIRVCRAGLRELLLPRIGQWPRGGRTGTLANLYASRLFDNKKLADLTTSPEILLLCTNLQSPTVLTAFSQDGLVEHDGETRKHVSTGQVSIGEAVAASSAFPLIFPPLSLTAKRLGVSQQDLGLRKLVLSDGGVFDNTGVQALRCLTDSKFETALVSDASAGLDWSPKRFASLQRLPRVANIMAQRIHAIERQLVISDERCVPLFLDQVTPTDVAKDLGLDKDSMRYVSELRTDLNGFKDYEVDSLVKCGYLSVIQNVHGKSVDAKEACRNLLLAADISPRDSEKPHEPRKLRRGAKRPIPPFGLVSLRDGVTWAWLVSIALVSIGWWIWEHVSATSP